MSVTDDYKNRTKASRLLTFLLFSNPCSNTQLHQSSLPSSPTPLVEFVKACPLLVRTVIGPVVLLVVAVESPYHGLQICRPLVMVMGMVVVAAQNYPLGIVAFSVVSGRILPLEEMILRVEWKVGRLVVRVVITAPCEVIVKKFWSCN